MNKSSRYTQQFRKKETCYYNKILVLICTTCDIDGL